jgi:hypothetical protein
MADPPPVTGQVTDAVAPSDAQAALYATLAQSLSVALQNIVAQQQQIIVLGQTAATAMRALLEQPDEARAETGSSAATRPPLDQASIGLIREVLATSPASAVLDSLITVMTANSIVNFSTLAEQLQTTLLAHATLVRELQQLLGDPAK